MSRAKKLPTGIDLRPSGLYRVRVSGFPSKSFSRLEDAEDHRRSLTVAKQTGRMDQVGSDLITLSELATEHFTAEGDSLSQRTLEGYNQQWRANVKTHHIANYPIRMLAAQPKLIEDFRDDLKAHKVGDASIRKTLAVIQTVLERGVRHGRIPYNPAKAVTKPSGKRKRVVKAQAPEQVEAIRRQLKNGDAVLVSVLAYSGMRPEEALALTWGDVQTRTLVIDEATEPDGTVKATKTERNRTAPLMAPLRDDLAAYRAASNNPKDSALIFPRADGAAWRKTDYANWRRRRWKPAVEKSKVDIERVYDLRHSAASLWLHEGVAPVRVASWMGHSLATLSSTYAHIIDNLDPDDRRAAVDIIKAARQDKRRTNLRVVTSPDQSAKPKPRRRRASAAK